MEVSRRALIGGGASLAGAGAVASLGQRPTPYQNGALSPVDLSALDIPFMLSVTDAAAGEFEILVGEQAITFIDRALAATLARAARKGGV